MLVLTRLIGEAIYIGDDIKVIVVDVRVNKGKPSVRLGIIAPSDVKVLREELTEGDRESNNERMD